MILQLAIYLSSTTKSKKHDLLIGLFGLSSLYFDKKRGSIVSFFSSIGWYSPGLLQVKVNNGRNGKC